MATVASLRTPEAEEKKLLSPRQTLENLFKANEKQLKAALPEHITPERMIRLALTQFSQNADLAKCDIRTIFASVIVSAQLGLEVGITGQGYLVPYKGKCTFVPGWRGLVDLVTRSGRAMVYTGVIYRDQKYTFTDGARRDLVVHNESALDEVGEITHVYAIGWINGVTVPIIELWPIAKVMRHRDKYNKVGAKHYSYNNFEMYARKIPLLQVIKYLPMSVQLANALEADRAAEEGRNITIDGNGIITPLNDDVQQSDEQMPTGGNTLADPADTGFVHSTPSSDHPNAPGNGNEPPPPADEPPVETAAESIARKLREATNDDDLDAAADLISSAPAQDQKSLSALYRERAKALRGGPAPSSQLAMSID
jgi:recombination protein RecT